MTVRAGLAAILGLLLLAAAGTGPAQAIEVISAQSAGLKVEINKGQLLRLDHPAETVFVADPTIADIQVKSPSLVYVFGKSVGETSLFAVDDRDQVLLNVSVRVVHDLTRLNAALRDLLPDSDIATQSVDGGLVVSGAVVSAVEVEDVRRLATRFIGAEEELINRVNVTGPNQINLRVRVAEVSRDVKQFGLNWDLVTTVGNFAFGIATGNPVVAAGAVLTRQGDADGLFVRRSTESLDLNVLIDALADEDLISLLAEPNLTALSGETASFLAGGEFPIPVPQSLDRITIEFKKFGVSLSFTPTLLASGRVSLRVRPEVSALSNAGAVQLQGFSIPALTTRRAETAVELGSGQSFAIAGLLQNNVTHDISKFPGLGDLPVLGPMFHSDTFQRDESELVIIVTPYIVRPISGQQLASPGDGLVAPSDVERIIFGRQYRPQLQDGTRAPVGPDTRGLTGPVGFALE
jgi:pilus assembly protein CpaC